MDNVLINITEVNEDVLIGVTAEESNIDIGINETIEQVLININEIFGIDGKDGIIKTYIAGVIMGSQRLVMLQGGQVVEFDQTNENNTYKAIGFTITSVLIGELVEVISLGILNNPGWGLTPDAIYYANGMGGISTIPPANGISQAIGMALDANNLFIDLNEPVIL